MDHLARDLIGVLLGRTLTKEDWPFPWDRIQKPKAKTESAEDVRARHTSLRQALAAEMKPGVT